MVTARRKPAPAPPLGQSGPVLHCDQAVQRWLDHYWQKLRLPTHELPALAITQDRQEYTRWTGKRLNFMVLGCYCYLPAPAKPAKSSHLPRSIKPALHTRSISTTSQARMPVQPLPGFEEVHEQSSLQVGHRHLVFIEPDMQPQSIEVTVAHELIHLADRVNGTPRRHRHHGYDSIAADEAAITGYGLEALRQLLHEESVRREHVRRERRPIRYLYQCPNCGKEYPRARRYSQAVSCSHCGKIYNPRFRLLLRT